MDERMSWMQKRHTTRVEDQVYSLLGMFGIFLVPNYGEGIKYAKRRFQRELDDNVSRPGSIHAAEVMKHTAKNVQGMQYAHSYIPSHAFTFWILFACYRR
jgi:hypothetical protein